MTEGESRTADTPLGDGAPAARADVDLDAIAANTRRIADHVGGRPVMAVVKADAYNHGAVPVARAALAAGASELGVTTLAEALALRDAGIGAPVLSWLHTPDADFVPAIRAGVELGLSTPRQLARVVDAARVVGVPAVVSTKVDTGLHRNGVSREEWPTYLDDLARAVAEGAVRARGLFSHLACGDEPDHPENTRQGERLVAAAADLRRVGAAPEVVHLANSPATLTRPDLWFDMVRPGIALYGLSPIPERGDYGLRPAMSVVARIAHVKRVPAGGGVSYGHTWTAPRDTTVALVPMGYADGVRRNLSGRLRVGIGGRSFPQVGRVCMDQFVVDLGDGGTGIREGDAAFLLGDGTHGEPTATEWAELLDTINYEIVTGIGGRTVRRHIGGTGHTGDTGETTTGETTTGETTRHGGNDVR